MKIAVYAVGDEQPISEIEVAAGELRLLDEKHGAISGPAGRTLVGLLARRYGGSGQQPFGLLVDGKMLNCKIDGRSRSEVTFVYDVKR